jgi:ribosomal-protein-alanine N-acetyltransferase
MWASLQTEGDWPEIVVFRRGWGRASARPWNPLTEAASVRLVRGTSAFLSEVRDRASQLSGGPVLSPALYPSASAIWVRAGFSPLLFLSIMEQSIGITHGAPDGVELVTEPDLDALESLDREAFDPFWHMGSAGLREALAATPASAVLQTSSGGAPTGYALVGAQLGVSFLQRIAVSPRERGQGLGRSLIDAARTWAKSVGAASMVLNVRPDNEPAIRLYERCGFEKTRGELQVMQWTPDTIQREPDASRNT